MNNVFFKIPDQGLAKEEVSQAKMLRHELPPLRLLLLLLPILCSTTWTPTVAQKTPASAVVGVRSHGVAIISPQPKADPAASESRNLSKAARHIFEEIDLNQNTVDNSILPRTRTRGRARMSKSDQATEEDSNTETLTAEESSNDPVSTWSDLIV